MADRDPDTIKQDIDQARDQLASTVDSLAERANPSRIADDVKAGRGAVRQEAGGGHLAGRYRRGRYGAGRPPDQAALTVVSAAAGGAEPVGEREAGRIGDAAEAAAAVATMTGRCAVISSAACRSVHPTEMMRPLRHQLSPRFVVSAAVGPACESSANRTVAPVLSSLKPALVGNVVRATKICRGVESVRITRLMVIAAHFRQVRTVDNAKIHARVNRNALNRPSNRR